MKTDGAQAVRDAIAFVLNADPTSVTFGLGVNDPGRVFGTTAGLVEEFGEDRVFETPTSEAAMTGIGVGLAISGRRVIHSHQRMDFALLAMDQIVNSAAKWKYMFGDVFEVPYLVRMIIGRGWGQGPTHSQNFESWFAHVPGLRVIVPASIQDLYDGVTALLVTDRPVIFIEHRWLHTMSGNLDTSKPPKRFLEPITHASEKAPEITFVSWGLSTYDCLAAKNVLESKCGIYSEVVQLRELCTDSMDKVLESVQVSNRLVLVSNSWGPASFATTVVSTLARASAKKIDFDLVHYPHTPEPTSLKLIKEFHVGPMKVANSALMLLGREVLEYDDETVDQPKGFNFGPF
jgi:pyruvate dehydrogenase E1 component beta subunit